MDHQIFREIVCLGSKIGLAILVTFLTCSSAIANEVAIANVSIIVHEGLSWHYGPVEHYVVTEIYTDIDQVISLKLQLLDDDKNIISEKNY